LLDPGLFFGGEWEPRGVADLTQPLNSTCGYYGGCFEGWPGPPDHGALLALRFLERDLGSVAFVFYADEEITAQAFEAASWNYEDSSGYNRLPAGDLAEEAFTFAEYVLWGEEDLEVFDTILEFKTCHSLVSISMMFPVPPSLSAEGRASSSADALQQVRTFADELERRVHVLACGE
jgi:hypothetical protein